MSELNSSCSPSLIWKNTQMSRIASFLSVCRLTITAIDKMRVEITALRRAVCESAEHYARRHRVANYVALIEAVFPSATSGNLDKARILAIRMQSALEFAAGALSKLPDAAIAEGGGVVPSVECVIGDLFKKSKNNAEMLLKMLDIVESEISLLQEVLVILSE
ncbi:hypothetical protein [Burkholderia glumae]|uniref:hypothetical protein n=2 Tax=Burkholderia glumae TaxID=337 RepID=UPI001F1CCF5C|nr:hypothetical protein [Burkholderia glumae]